MKNIIRISGLFVCYILSCSPLLLMHCEWAIPLLKHHLIVDIFWGVMVLAVISIFFSLMAAALRWYLLAYVIALIPLFVEAVLLCSAVLVFLFHKEIAAAALFGKIRKVGEMIMQLLKWPCCAVKGIVGL